jgi:hypothetical protein
MIDKNEVKKELYKSKVNAKFTHYAHGNVYYSVEIENGLYEFPISTVDTFSEDENGNLYKLSTDLGTTSFCFEMKASNLNRWIAKAIDNNEFIKIG